jgi:hypothetical protein
VPKAPTIIQYDSGSKDSFKWGYELDMSLGDKITGLKLLLDPDQPRPYFIPTNIQAEIAKLPKTVLEVASDYMRAVFQHALKEIESESLDPSFLDNYHKQFVLTVPAVWSDKAKDMTLRVRLLLPLLLLMVLDCLYKSLLTCSRLLEMLASTLCQ